MSSQASEDTAVSPRCRNAKLPVTLAAAALLAGCADAITVHSIVLRDDPVPDVPSLAGRWQPAETGGASGFLTIEGSAEDRGQCRDGSGRFTSGGDEFSAERVCLLELDGNLIAEIKSGPPIEGFYRQYLVRVQEDRLEVCGEVPVWVLFQVLAKEHPVGYSLDALQYTIREQDYYSLMVLISKPDELREFLKTALPELVTACDTHASSEITWAVLERVTDEAGVPATVAPDQE